MRRQVARTPNYCLAQDNEGYSFSRISTFKKAFGVEKLNKARTVHESLKFNPIALLTCNRRNYLTEGDQGW